MALACLQFAGCASTRTLAEGQAVVDRAQTPGGQARLAAECEQQPMQPDLSATLASIMEVPQAEAKKEFCQRIIAALANGKLSAAQFVDVANVKASPETMGVVLRVIAGADQNNLTPAGTPLTWTSDLSSKGPSVAGP